MKLLRRIWFPLAAVTAAAATMFASENRVSFEPGTSNSVQDTVIYESSGYRRHMAGDFIKAFTDTSMLAQMPEDSTSLGDTTRRLTIRDTVQIPDSLLGNPFMCKYYYAIIDSTIYKQVKDSLLMAGDSLDWPVLDSLHVIEMDAQAKEAFAAWYAGLSDTDRKAYDKEQEALAKLAALEKKRLEEEDRKERRDSAIKETPRILSTFALPDSMHYKQIIHWTTDPDFHAMDVSTVDTSYNYHFYDYKFRRDDVNATWLGVAGSGVQSYNFFKRRSVTDVDFYTALESWTSDPGTVNFYNTKTPYTELAYTGTLFAGSSKESDNVHIFTTQNISPAFNFAILYDRWGGAGMLQNEETNNKNINVTTNYLGKKYLMHFAFMRNNVTRQENGGIQDNMWIQDTTVQDTKEIPVNLSNGNSNTTKNSFLLEQQFRIPFTFLVKHKADTAATDTLSLSGATAPAATRDSIIRDVTTAFIGHTTEFSMYDRDYSDQPGTSKFFDNNFYSSSASADTFSVKRLDNKVFLRLQPWADDAAISKISVGIGDKLNMYGIKTPQNCYSDNENTVYAYAGASGQISKYADWKAKGHLSFAGVEAGDFDIQGDANFHMYPFRKARTSSLTVGAHFEMNSKTPTWFQRQFYSNHFVWRNDFTKSSEMRIQGYVDIPYWKTYASVGYAVLGNTVYYDNSMMARQNTGSVSVLSASLRKDFDLGWLHLDNQLLTQFSSDASVVPVPALAVNLKYYAQFAICRNKETGFVPMWMQIGINGWWNTKWNSPGWNPVLGAFYNQTTETYNNGPVFDVFVNVQWHRTCIFIKMENLGQGWPRKYGKDYFSADHYILTTRGLSGLKIGIFWPFYINPFENKKIELNK